ncbi:MAG: hypothetical protein LBN10_11450 [Propionibacteriaceae bacterium]|jgi:hypothetical protein|nr:hypothetical protein [Propionibacteriaceae bacterium]
MSESTPVDLIPELVPEFVIDGVVAKHVNPDPIEGAPQVPADSIAELVEPILVGDEVIAKHGIAPESDEAEASE